MLRATTTAVAALCVLTVLAPGADAAKAPVTALVATASFPNEAAVQSVTYDVREPLQDVDGQIESRPSADTMVVVAPRHVKLLRNHRWVIHRVAKPCLRIRVEASLYLGPWDPRVLVWNLLPAADGPTLYEAISRSAQPLGAGVPPDVEVSREQLLPAWQVGAQSGYTVLRDWRRDGRYGFEAITVRSTVLRTKGDCSEARYVAPLIFTNSHGVVGGS